MEEKVDYKDVLVKGSLSKAGNNGRSLQKAHPEIEKKGRKLKCFVEGNTVNMIDMLR